MRIYSHRGMQQKAPENTLAAYQCAIDHGFDIELDVQMTKDGELICFHDWQLGRTAPGAGMVWGYTLAELSELDAGGWFSDEFKGEPIPTLRQALTLAKGKAQLAIEMKMPGIDVPLLDLIAELGMFDQVYVFDIPQDYYLPSRLKTANSRVSRYTSIIALLVPTMFWILKRFFNSRSSRSFCVRSSFRSLSTRLFSLTAAWSIVRSLPQR